MNSEELRQLTDRVWIIPGPTNIGVIQEGEGIWLVDSGNDKEAGRKINKILKARNWELKGILNTHSNADHIGGNDYLQRQYDCGVYAGPVESAFVEFPFLEASFLWGGFPPDDLDNKFFRAKPSEVRGFLTPEKPAPLPGLTIIPLPGHYFDMVGILTADGVYFLGDCLFGSRILEKYGIPFIYDVAAYRRTLETLRETGARWFVPSHGEAETDFRETVEVNLRAVEKAEAVLLELLREELTFEEILKGLCDRYGIRLDCGQYALVGSTVRSFLSWLKNTGRIGHRFLENRMCWRINPAPEG